MLRITPSVADGEFLLKLEGCLTGAWVPELGACWRELLAMAPHRPVRVDLTDVSRVDAAGRALMTSMYREGVRFVATGFIIPDLLREIASAANRELSTAEADRRH